MNCLLYILLYNIFYKNNRSSKNSFLLLAVVSVLQISPVQPGVGRVRGKRGSAAFELYFRVSGCMATVIVLVNQKCVNSFGTLWINPGSHWYAK